MKNVFQLTVDEQTYDFELDEHGTVWLKEKNKSGTNQGQTKPAKNLDEAKEIARLMLYAMGRTKTP